MECFLEQLNLEKSKLVAYDPHKVISKQSLANKNFAYDFQPISEWEKVTIKESWEDIEYIQKTLVEHSGIEHILG